jgi:hypothetical protein
MRANPRDTIGKPKTEQEVRRVWTEENVGIRAHHGRSLEGLEEGRATLRRHYALGACMAKLHAKLPHIPIFSLLYSSLVFKLQSHVLETYQTKHKTHGM